VNMALKLRVPYEAGNFSTSCATVNFSRRAVVHGASLSISVHKEIGGQKQDQSHLCKLLQTVIIIIIITTITIPSKDILCFVCLWIGVNVLKRKQDGIQCLTRIPFTITKKHAYSFPFYFFSLHNPGWVINFHS
jgi:hypothetical protein